MQEENNSNNQNNYRGMSQETEKLLQKYLKLEIASRIWNTIFRLVVIIMMGFGIIFTTSTFVPMITKQLGALTGGTVSNSGGMDMESISKIVNMMVQEQVKGASDSANFVNEN